MARKHVLGRIVSNAKRGFWISLFMQHSPPLFNEGKSKNPEHVSLRKPTEESD